MARTPGSSPLRLCGRGDVAIPPYRSRQFGPDSMTSWTPVDRDRRNPTMQLRAIRARSQNGESICVLVLTLVAGGESQSHRHARDLGSHLRDPVAIPPYRSGQFGPVSTPSCWSESSGRKRRKPTIQINSDGNFTFPPCDTTYGSQSHHADQGSSKEATDLILSGHQDQEVAIPPCRLGQFQGIGWAMGMTRSCLGRNPTVQIRAIRTKS
jgi:hypothetical protein